MQPDRPRFQDVWYLCIHKGYSKSYGYSSIIISPPVALILKTVKLQNSSALPAVSRAYQATQSHVLSSRQYWSSYQLCSIAVTVYNFDLCHFSLEGAKCHTATRYWPMPTDINCYRQSVYGLCLYSLQQKQCTSKLTKHYPFNDPGIETRQLLLRDGRELITNKFKCSHDITVSRGW